METFYIYKYYIADEAGELAFLPMMQRRKLSHLSKIAFTTLFECLEEGAKPRLVFASQYGEFDRLLKLIEQYQTEGEVSPSAFSMSVHNATIGGFSLLNHITAPYNSISAGKNTLSTGLLDAIMNSGKGEVLFCYADAGDKSSAYADEKSISCSIGREPKDGSIEVSFEQCGTSTPGDEYEAFVKFLKGETLEFSANFYKLTRSK